MRGEAINIRRKCESGGVSRIAGEKSTNCNHAVFDNEGGEEKEGKLGKKRMRGRGAL